MLFRSGFWADKGTADEKARLVISNIKNSKVGILGTLGAYPDSDHCKEMQERVASLVRDNGNQVLGTFMSMGKVDPRLIEAFKQFPEGHPHALNDERKKRHAEAAKHPNEQDYINANKAREKKVVKMKEET